MKTSSTGTRSCPKCGKPVAAKVNKYCSEKCYHDSTRNGNDHRCARCGKSFYFAGKRKYCSSACRFIVIPGDMSARTLFRRRKAAGLVKESPRHSFNEAFFLDWSTGLAWLLGLIWSDGNLKKSGNTIGITSKDYDLLEQVKILIGFTGTITTRKSGHHDIHFSSPTVANHLRSLGLTPAKSLTANYPPIPLEYEADFFRGMMDGDGWVTLLVNRKGQKTADLKVGVCGAAPLLGQGLTRSLDRLGIAHTFHWRHRTPYNPMWRLMVEAQHDCRKLHALIYREGCPALARKKIKYDQWMDTPRTPSGNPTVAIYLEHEGKRLTISDWAKELNLSKSCIGERLKRGWTTEESLSPERRKGRPPARILNHQGRGMEIKEWAIEKGISTESIQWRLRDGWSIHDALETPFHTKRRKCERGKNGRFEKAGNR